MKKRLFSVFEIFLLTCLCQLTYADKIGFPVSSSLSAPQWNALGPGLTDDVNYNTTTIFQMQPGSAGEGNVVLTLIDNDDPFCSSGILIEDPGTCSIFPPCPTGFETTVVNITGTCANSIDVDWLSFTVFGLMNGTWEGFLNATHYDPCVDGNGPFYYNYTPIGCAPVQDTLYFEWTYDPPCNWQLIFLCWDGNELNHIIGIPPFPGNDPPFLYQVFNAYGQSNGFYLSDIVNYVGGGLFEVDCGLPPCQCMEISVIPVGGGCEWYFGGIYSFNNAFNIVVPVQCDGSPCGNCPDPPYAGEDNSINICVDDGPFDLTTSIGGSPDPGGSWTPPLNSGGNIYDPLLDGTGIFTYTLIGTSGCPNDDASITIQHVDLNASIVNETCFNNNTPQDNTDDIIQISFTPIGIHTGVNYSVAVSSGAIAPSTGIYNTTTIFQMQPGSADGGNVTLMVTDNASPFCSFELIIADPGSCSSGQTCPESQDTTFTICPFWDNINAVLPFLGIPEGGIWVPPLADPFGEAYYSCADSASIYIYQHDYPGCPSVFDSVHFDLIWDPCAWELQNVCYTDNTIMFTVPPYPGQHEASTYGFQWFFPGDTFNLDSSYDLSLPSIPGPHCYDLQIVLFESPSCWWTFGELVAWDFYSSCTDVPCGCTDPSYAGEDNTINICIDTNPFDLTTVLGGNPDVGGTWSPLLNSGGNIYDPLLDGAGIFTYTVIGILGCPDDNASVAVTVQQIISPPITGVPNSICEPASSFALPTNQNGIIGIWSGQGVSNNFFDPSGLNGIITLTFTPNPQQCATAATFNIVVEPYVSIFITGIQDSICQINPSIPLPTLQSGINGSWSGAGVSSNTFSPFGLSGNIMLTFTPNVDECADVTTKNIFVELPAPIIITGLPDSLCQLSMPVGLPAIQSGYIGVWSGPGVSSNIFNSSGQSGNVTLTFTPEGSQCASPTNANIFVTPAVIPMISGIPDSLCQFDMPVVLPALQNGFIGIWSGPGVTSNTFNPSGQNGNVSLTFTPEAGQCASPTNAIIIVTPIIIPMITGIPDSLCQSNAPISLPVIQSNVVGNWTGPGVTSNIFNPAGFNGDILLSFTPNNGQCALGATTTIAIFDVITLIITGVPSSLCESSSPVSLPTLQNGVAGNWSGPGISSNIFNPSGLSGNINIIFSPDDNQCATSTSANINVEPTITPIVTGIPGSLCQLNPIIPLPVIISGITGNWAGQGVLNNNFSPSGLNGNILLTFSPLAGQCAIEASTNIDVIPIIIPVISGIPFSFCESDSIIALSDTQSGITGNWLGSGISNNKFDPSGLNGNIMLTFVPSAGQCADTSSIQINIKETPSFLNLVALCDSLAQTYVVSFDITGGSSGSYTVNGLPVNGNNFISASIPADSTSYIFILDDGNGCGPVNINGYHNCACPTSAGSMDFGINPIKVCEGYNFIVAHHHDELLDSDDLFQFAIHDQTGTILGTIFSLSDSILFNFPTGISFGQTYYVSALVGSNNGNGNIDLNDPCLSVSQGVPLIFYPSVKENVVATLCSSESMVINGHLYDKSNPSGEETLPGASVFGCDSIVTVDLSFEEPDTFKIIQTLCEDESILVNGNVYNLSHPNGYETFIGAICDSTVNIQLSFLLPSEYNLNETLCFGSSITVNGTVYDESNSQGTEVFDHADINGCDSIVYILLTFDSVIVENLKLTLCPGESLVVNGTTYNEAHDQGIELIPFGNCDSIINVDLDFYPPVVFRLKDTLCTGDSLMINGAVFNETNSSGTLILPNASVTGCDSTIEVSLDYYPVALGHIFDTLQTGDSIIISGHLYNQSNPNGTEIIPGSSYTGCDSTVIISLHFENTILEVSVKVEPPLCFNGKDGVITITSIVGGVTPYTLRLDIGTTILFAGPPFEVTGLVSGLHTLTIEDGTGTMILLEIEIPETPVLKVNAGDDQIIQFGDDALLLAEATLNVFEWLWSPGDYLSCTDCPDPVVQIPDKDITYSILVTDANGCFAFDDVSIFVGKENEIYLPSIFSPNDDGINDVVTIYATSVVNKIKSLRFFSRWGEVVSEKYNFLPNDINVGWDGSYRGEKMNPGVFVWLAEIEFTDGEIKTISGEVTLVR